VDHAKEPGLRNRLGRRVRGRRGGVAQPAWGHSSFGANADSFRSPPVPLQKADPAHGLKAGQKVFHNKFGEGKVLAIEGTGDDARAQVDFPRHGVKWLALSVAKLTPI
jgi:DNA helicase-2/ATP-dependent DNA helicase PcrA